MPDLLAIQLGHVSDQCLSMSRFRLGMCLLITSHLGVSHNTKHGTLFKDGDFNRITLGPGTLH